MDREASLQTLGSSHTMAGDGEGGNRVGVGETSPNCTLVPGGTPFGKAGYDPELLKSGHKSLCPGTLLPDTWTLEKNEKFHVYRPQQNTDPWLIPA